MTTRRRPPALRRSWLFAGGAEAPALAALSDGPADVLIHELEDFTAPGQRPAARALIPGLMRAWRAAGKVAAVRINPLETPDGPLDLAACFAGGVDGGGGAGGGDGGGAGGAPDAVLLPKVAEPAQVAALSDAIDRLEAEADLPAGAVELVPNIELARGLMQTYAVATASPRVTACLVASEDMVADLGAERGRDGRELAYVRERFHLECRAAGVVSIDCPYTFTDDDGLTAETRDARRLGMTAKSCVAPGHAGLINALLTPEPTAVAHARRVVETFEEAQARGLGVVELDGVNLELPIVLNARRLIARAEVFAALA